MSRLTIDITEQQHQALKAMAALQGKTIKQLPWRNYSRPHRTKIELGPI